jgi:hypothetical protein
MTASAWSLAWVDEVVAHSATRREQGRAHGLEGLRFHDLRGTAVTNFVLRAGIDLGDMATIVGWKKARVEEIAARYVTAEAIGLAIVETLGRNKAQTEAAKGVVKDT